MVSLNIRNVPEEVVRAIKAAAAQSGLTLREYVIRALTVRAGDFGNGGLPVYRPGDTLTDKQIEVAEKQQSSALQEARKRLEEGIRSVEESDFASRKRKTCPHGIERGVHCWRCGGAARVETGRV
ncbi:MAG TPA: hypothetical protein VGT24_01610 [Candidatus Acidoferrales bacterium]|nr:hypothetical protein [Candidatus Acidoferrales bacterium]